MRIALILALSATAAGAALAQPPAGGGGMDPAARFKAIRRNNDSHQIEEVGEKLRAMMPWIGKNKLVDKARN